MTRTPEGEALLKAIWEVAKRGMDDNPVKNRELCDLYDACKPYLSRLEARALQSQEAK